MKVSSLVKNAIRKIGTLLCTPSPAFSALMHGKQAGEFCPRRQLPSLIRSPDSARFIFPRRKRSSMRPSKENGFNHYNGSKLYFTFSQVCRLHLCVTMRGIGFRFGRAQVVNINQTIRLTRNCRSLENSMIVSANKMSLVMD